MPTYDYVCDACDHSFAEMQKMEDRPLQKCPKCGKKKLRRLFGTGAAILFKGSGFYINETRSDRYKQAAQAEQNQAKAASNSGDKAGNNGAAAPAPQAGPAKEATTTGKKAK
jgi:putative FmdB family regulatory protein